METPEKLDIIINPKSGTVLAAGLGRVEADLRAIFGESAGDIRPVEGPGLRGAVRQWVAEHDGGRDGHGLIMFAGDGSILAAAEEVLNTDVTLGVLPGGTQNFVANLLGFSPDYKEAAAQYKKVTVQTIDVGRVNGQYFLYGLLLDKGTVALLDAREDLRNGTYRKALSKGFDFVAGIGWREKTALRMTDEKGVTTMVEGRILTITNNEISPRSNAAQGLPPPTAAGMKRIFANTFGKAEEGDGLLAFYAHPGGFLHLAAMVPQLWRGDWPENASLTIHRGASFTLEPAFFDEPDARMPWINVVADGEKAALQFPLKVDILPRALRLLKPA